MPSIFSPEQKLAIREQLLCEGERMMLERGITGMKLEELARSAGIAKGTFYNFFKTKQHFILAIIRRYQQQRYAVLIKEAESRRGSLSLYAAVELFLSIYDPEQNPMFHMRSRDLDWIGEKIPASELFDPEMDLKCVSLFMSCVKGLRQDADMRVVSNFSRMVMFTLMQADCTHKEVLGQNIRMIISMLVEYLTGEKDCEDINSAAEGAVKNEV